MRRCPFSTELPAKFITSFTNDFALSLNPLRMMYVWGFFFCCIKIELVQNWIKKVSTSYNIIQLTFIHISFNSQILFNLSLIDTAKVSRIKYVKKASFTYKEYSVKLQGRRHYCLDFQSHVQTSRWEFPWKHIYT